MAAPDPASVFLARINRVRSSHGLAPLRADAAVAAFAAGWTGQMVSANHLAHNPDLRSAPGSWSVAGENVGVGASVDDLFKAFVASPEHYANIVEPRYNVVGVAVKIDKYGSMWTTHDFEQATPAAATTPAPAPGPDAPPRQSPSPRASRGGPRSTDTTAPAAPAVDLSAIDPVPAPSPGGDAGPADGPIVAAPEWIAYGAKAASSTRQGAFPGDDVLAATFL